MSRTPTLLPFLLLLAVAAGCKKPVPVEDPVRAVAPPVEEAKPVATPAQQVARNFERVNFEFDSATLTAEAKVALDDNARILSEVPDLRIQVQGHCDDRGTTDYNVALGQQRAAAVQKYLMAAGVAATRVETLSYGEEKPLTSGEGEHVWAQNRRAEFLVLGGASSPVQGTTR